MSQTVRIANTVRHRGDLKPMISKYQSEANEVLVSAVLRCHLRLKILLGLIASDLK